MLPVLQLVWCFVGRLFAHVRFLQELVALWDAIEVPEGVMAIGEVAKHELSSKDAL